mmetsp:Transcript_41886/g.135548  ORF Transcript_41886/g.135548 Transcript_41886/m.135548 type:complete len:113 (+) Transcript_41886:2593-2931(+)
MVCGAFGHWSRECPNGGKNRCLVCGKLGHRARDCPEGAEWCAICSKVGHSGRECPGQNPGREPRRAVCFDFRIGLRCKFGSGCPFSHDDAPAGKGGFHDVAAGARKTELLQL